MKARMFVFFALLAGSVFAVTVISPVGKEVKNGDMIDLGKIGPGQTISVLIEPEVSTGGIYGTGGLYDMAVVSGVPEGWRGENSKLYKPLQATVTASPAAEEGEYYAYITLVDENYGEKLDNVTFAAKVTITYDVVDVDISPSYVRTGPDQPAVFSITIANKGSTGDAFEIKAVGQKRWDFQRSVFVPAQSSKTIYYEIAGAEEETYKTTVSVTSLASPIIHDEKEITVDIQSNIIDDIKATNNGVLIFPIFEGIVYAFFGLIGNFL
ncbi:hypothetical protein H0O02_04655 [Candidatus Micrarchaeota archaeon]|nr:hypothetical protein [Candidatus Micrarchaeota archaeon]